MVEVSKRSTPQVSPSVGEIAALAWPLGLNAMLLQSVVVIDALLVSVLGEAALAAMGLATSITILLVGLLFALSNATQILVAQAHGAADPTALKTAYICGTIISVFMSALGLILVWQFGDAVVFHFAHSPDIAADAVAYLAVFAVVVVCESVSQPLTCYFNGIGKTRLPLFSRLAEMPVNIGLSIVLIHGLLGFPELGVVGAAAGSAVASGVRLIFLSVCLWRFETAMLRADGWAQSNLPQSLGHHFIFSLPIVFTFFSVSVANSICGFLYARLSLNQFAAMTLILPWMMVLGHVMMSWAQATGIFVGQLLGSSATNANLDAFLSRAWRTAILLGGLVSLLYFTASLSFPHIYTELQPETQATLWSFAPTLVLLTFPKISNAICGNTLRAGGDTVRVMNIFILDQWLVRVPMTAFLILYLDVPAGWVFSLFLIQEIIKFPLFHLRFFSGKWRKSLIEA
ncbi:MAG: MATE family efflux transporter [Rhizobiaceae bacterium]